MKRTKRMKRYKVRSGKRVLGTIDQVSADGFLWRANRTGGDSGISSDLEKASNNVIRDYAGSGTVEGFKRVYDVSVTSED